MFSQIFCQIYDSFPNRRPIRLLCAYCPKKLENSDILNILGPNPQNIEKFSDDSGDAAKTSANGWFRRAMGRRHDEMTRIQSNFSPASPPMLYAMKEKRKISWGHSLWSALSRALKSRLLGFLSLRNAQTIEPSTACYGGERVKFQSIGVEIGTISV